MQDPNEDTQWNDILRSKGIIPPKEKEISENDIVNLVESTISQKNQSNTFSYSSSIHILIDYSCYPFSINSADEKEMKDMSLDELDELEDEEDELVLLRYRNQRIAEMKALAEKAKYGNVMEISAVDYVEQVNKAGSDVYVVLHLYKQGYVSKCVSVLYKFSLKFEYFLLQYTAVCFAKQPLGRISHQISKYQIFKKYRIYLYSKLSG